MVFWCHKCGEPVFDKELHACKCDGKITQISTSASCNPVFLQERKMLSYIAGEDFSSAKMWDLGSGHYIVNGKKQDIRYKPWYDAKEHLKYAEQLRSNIEIEEDYSPYYGAVEANLEYLQKLILEAEMYTASVYNKFSAKGFYPTVSFSGGKDSTVVSKIVRDALQTASIPHFFGDTTLEFAETFSVAACAYTVLDTSVAVFGVVGSPSASSDLTVIVGSTQILLNRILNSWVPFIILVPLYTSVASVAVLYEYISVSTVLTGSIEAIAGDSNNA